MRQRRFLVIAFIAVFIGQNYLAYAEKGKSTDEKQAEMRKMLEEKKLELNGTQWAINIASQTAKGKWAGPDKLTFQDGKFYSDSLSKKGYASTNYTLTVQEGGPTVWETMQTSDKEGVTFWRGEWKEDSMTGVINHQLKEGVNEEYYFTSSAKKAIPPSSEKKEEEKAAEQKQIEETAAAPEPVKQSAPKKGWFS